MFRSRLSYFIVFLKVASIPLICFARTSIDGVLDAYSVLNNRNQLLYSSELKFTIVHDRRVGSSRYGLSLSPVINVRSFGSGAAARAYGFISGNLGKLYIGHNLGAAHMLQSDNLRNYALSHASFLHVSLQESDMINEQKALVECSLTPGLWTDQLHFQDKMVLASKIAAKISYIAPPIADHLFLGFSYIPNSKWSLQTRRRDSEETIHFQNVIQFIAAYQVQVRAVDLKTHIALEHGDALSGHSSNKRYGLRAWDWGVQSSYMGFDIGLSYGNLGKSGNLYKVVDPKSSKYYTCSLSYSISRLSSALLYFHSKSTKDTLSRYSLVTSYRLINNVKIYGELAHSKILDKTDSAQCSKFNAAIVGFNVRF